ncbi:MAG: hypothetical protein ACR2KJ_07855 [Jatrophihabitans sp.]
MPERTVVHGHTHLQYQRKAAGRRIVGCGSVGLPYHDGPPAALWTLADTAGLHARQTAYDVEGAAARIQATDFPAAARYASTMRTPPNPDEIAADTEAKHFSD